MRVDEQNLLVEEVHGALQANGPEGKTHLSCLLNVGAQINFLILREWAQYIIHLSTFGELRIHPES